MLPAEPRDALPYTQLGGAAAGALFGGVILWQGVSAALLVFVCACIGAALARVAALLHVGALDPAAAWRALWRDKPH